MKIRIWQRLAMAAPAVAGLLAAAPANGIGGPVSGFVMDGRNRVLRPINGLPGSATLGAAVPLPFSAGLAAVATGLDYALITDAHGAGAPLLARGLASGAPAATPLPGGIATSAAVLSSSGTAAVLYSKADARLQFVSGLPTQPQAGNPVDLSELNGGVSALAVDSAGRTALLIAGDGSIYRAGADGQGPSFIVRAAGASSVSIFPNGQDAVVGNRDTGDVLLIRGFAGAASVSTITGAGAGIASATAVQALSDHEAGIVDGAGRLAIVDIDTSAVSWINLAGKADRIEPVDRNLLLLNHLGSGPLLLLDLTNGRTAYFVPTEAATNLDTHRGNDIWKH
jgi:hypothetical protein